MVPAMARQIARKDDLGDSISRMRGLFGPEEFDFHPATFVFPRYIQVLSDFVSTMGLGPNRLKIR